MTKKTMGVSQISDKWIDDIVTIHMQAFPKSIFTKLGRKTVRRYYLWQFEGPHDLIALGIIGDQKLIGYLIGGVFRGALIGFLKKYSRFLFWQVLMHPWLLLNEEVREPIFFAGKYYLANLLRRKQAEVTELVSTSKPAGILSVAVDPSFLRKGHGKMLVSEFETLATKKNYSELRLSVGIKNEAAINFYQKLGWHISHTKPKQYTMSKIL